MNHDPRESPEQKLERLWLELDDQARAASVAGVRAVAREIVVLVSKGYRR
jgi:hypothetical protein